MQVFSDGNESISGPFTFLLVLDSTEVVSVKSEYNLEDNASFDETDIISSVKLIG